MKPSTFLAFLAPAAVLADSQQPAGGASLSSDLAHNSPAVSLPELAPREQFAPFADRDLPSDEMRLLAARYVLQARSEGSLGQTPWIGMAIGLTFTALAAVMLGLRLFNGETRTQTQGWLSLLLENQSFALKECFDLLRSHCGYWFNA
ncbi:unnamed protein product [Penicillium discolor]